ncbi:1017_t:CDS:1, partial [Racocetra persica]
MPKQKNKVYKMLQEYNNKRRKQVTKRQKKDIVDVLGDDCTENDIWAEDIFAKDIRDEDVFAEDVFSDNISTKSSEFDKDKSEKELEEE